MFLSHVFSLSLSLPIQLKKKDLAPDTFANLSLLPEAKLALLSLVLPLCFPQKHR